MKIFRLFRKKYYAVFSAFILLIASCTSNTSEEIGDPIAEYNEIVKKYEGIRKRTLNVKRKLNNTKKLLKKSNNYQITQEEIDYYLNELNFDKGSVTVSQVEEVFIENKQMIEQGYNNYINSTNLSSYTKSQMLALAEGHILENLELDDNFNELASTEKEMIVMGNEYNKESLEHYGKSYHAKGLDSFESGLIGAIVVGLITGGTGGMILGFFTGTLVHGISTK